MAGVETTLPVAPVRWGFLSPLARRQYAAGERQALLLAAGEVHAFFADVRLQALGQLADYLGEVGGGADLQDLFVAERETEGDVIGNGIFKDFGFLREQRDGFVERIERRRRRPSRNRGSSFSADCIRLIA